MGKDIHHNIIFNLELLLKVKKTMSPSMGEWAMQQGFLWCSNDVSILKEISNENSLEGLMLKLKRQYFGHLM